MDANRLKYDAFLVRLEGLKQLLCSPSPPFIFFHLFSYSDAESIQAVHCTVIIAYPSPIFILALRRCMAPPHHGLHYQRPLAAAARLQRTLAFLPPKVVHGTDTMAYTASALSLLLRGFKRPIVLTGSQMPLSAPRSDARSNLLGK